MEGFRARRVVSVIGLFLALAGSATSGEETCVDLLQSRATALSRGVGKDVSPVESFTLEIVQPAKGDALPIGLLCHVERIGGWASLVVMTEKGEPLLVAAEGKGLAVAEDRPGELTYLDELGFRVQWTGRTLPPNWIRLGKGRQTTIDMDVGGLVLEAMNKASRVKSDSLNRRIDIELGDDGTMVVTLAKRSESGWNGIEAVEQHFASGGRISLRNLRRNITHFGVGCSAWRVADVDWGRWKGSCELQAVTDDGMSRLLSRRFRQRMATDRDLLRASARLYEVIPQAFSGDELAALKLSVEAYCSSVLSEPAVPSDHVERLAEHLGTALEKCVIEKVSTVRSIPYDNDLAGYYRQDAFDVLLMTLGAANTRRLSMALSQAATGTSERNAILAIDMLSRTGALSDVKLRARLDLRIAAMPDRRRQAWALARIASRYARRQDIEAVDSTTAVADAATLPMYAEVLAAGALSVEGTAVQELLLRSALRQDQVGSRSFRALVQVSGQEEVIVSRFERRKVPDAYLAEAATCSNAALGQHHDLRARIAATFRFSDTEFLGSATCFATYAPYLKTDDVERLLYEAQKGKDSRWWVAFMAAPLDKLDEVCQRNGEIGKVVAEANPESRQTLATALLIRVVQGDNLDTSRFLRELCTALQSQQGESARVAMEAVWLSLQRTGGLSRDLLDCLVSTFRTTDDPALATHAILILNAASDSEILRSISDRLPEQFTADWIANKTIVAQQRALCLEAISGWMESTKSHRSR